MNFSAHPHSSEVVDSAFKILVGDLNLYELTPGNSRDIYLPWFGWQMVWSALFHQLPVYHTLLSLGVCHFEVCRPTAWHCTVYALHYTIRRHNMYRRTDMASRAEAYWPITVREFSEKFPEIRKFQIERKNFRKNETVSLDKNNWSKRGKRVWNKGNMYQNSLIKNQNGNLSHTLMLSQEL